MWVNQFRMKTGNSFISNFNWIHKKNFSTNWIPFTENLGADLSTIPVFPYSLVALSSTRKIHFAHVQGVSRITGLEMTCVTRRTRKVERGKGKSSTLHGCSSVQAELCDPRNNLVCQRDVSLWRCLQRCRTRHADISARLGAVIELDETFRHLVNIRRAKVTLFTTFSNIFYFSSLSLYSSTFDDILKNYNSVELKLDDGQAFQGTRTIFFQFFQFHYQKNNSMILMYKYKLHNYRLRG